jgi:hypothetical protein
VANEISKIWGLTSDTSRCTISRFHLELKGSVQSSTGFVRLGPPKWWRSKASTSSRVGEGSGRCGLRRRERSSLCIKYALIIFLKWRQTLLYRRFKPMEDSHETNVLPRSSLFALAFCGAESCCHQHQHHLHPPHRLHCPLRCPQPDGLCVGTCDSDVKEPCLRKRIEGLQFDLERGDKVGSYWLTGWRLHVQLHAQSPQRPG